MFKRQRVLLLDDKNTAKLTVSKSIISGWSHSDPGLANRKLPSLITSLLFRIYHLLLRSVSSNINPIVIRAPAKSMGSRKCACIAETSSDIDDDDQYTGRSAVRADGQHDAVPAARPTHGQQPSPPATTPAPPAPAPVPSSERCERPKNCRFDHVPKYGGSAQSAAAESGAAALGLEHAGAPESVSAADRRPEGEPARRTDGRVQRLSRPGGRDPALGPSAD